MKGGARGDWGFPVLTCQATGVGPFHSERGPEARRTIKGKLRAFHLPRRGGREGLDSRCLTVVGPRGRQGFVRSFPTRTLPGARTAPGSSGTAERASFPRSARVEPPHTPRAPSSGPGALSRKFVFPSPRGLTRTLQPPALRGGSGTHLCPAGRPRLQSLHSQGPGARAGDWTPVPAREGRERGPQGPRRGAGV